MDDEPCCNGYNLCTPCLLALHDMWREDAMNGWGVPEEWFA